MKKYIRVTYKEAAPYVAEYMDYMNSELKAKGKDLDLYDEVPDHKNDYLSKENNDKYLALINNAISSVKEDSIKGYLEEIKINILYSIMNEKNMNYSRKKSAFDEFCILVKKYEISKPYEFGISMEEYINKIYPRKLKKYSYFVIKGRTMFFKKKLPPYPYKEYPIIQQPSLVPTSGQQAQIDRKFGMFLHFGINTFNNTEWSDSNLD